MANALAEIVNLRNRDLKVFSTDEPRTRIAVVQSGQHFEHPTDGWVDIDQLMQPIAGGWQAQMKDVTFGISSGSLAIAYKGHSLTMRPTSVWMVDRTAPGTRRQKLADASYANVARLGRAVTVTDIFPGVDLTLVFTAESVSKAFTIQSKPNLPDPVALGWNPSTTYLAFVWDVQLPAQAVVRDAETNAVVANGYVGKNDLLVQDGQGQTIVTFPKGRARGNSGVSGPVWYLSAGAQVPFAEAIEYRVTQVADYPLLVDPTATISTTTTADDGYLVSYDGGSTGSAVTSTNWDYWGRFITGGKSPTDEWNRAYWRYDLSALSGTCLRAKWRTTQAINYSTPGGSGYGSAQKVSDWGTLDFASDWGLTGSSLNSDVGGEFPLFYLDEAFASSGSLVVAVSVGDAAYPRTTANGKDWTRTTGSSLNFWRVRYLNGEFVGIVASGGYGRDIYTSPDGETWTYQSQPAGTTKSIVDIAYGNGYYMVVTTGSYVYRATSLTGTWTAKLSGSPALTSVYCIAYANSTWCIGYNSGGSQPVYYSTDDGGTWAYMPAATGCSKAQSLAYYNGLWYLAQSPNVVGFSSTTSSPGSQWGQANSGGGVVPSGEMVIPVGTGLLYVQSGTCWYSADGKSYTAHTIPATAHNLYDHAVGVIGDMVVIPGAWSDDKGTTWDIRFGTSLPTSLVEASFGGRLPIKLVHKDETGGSLIERFEDYTSAATEKRPYLYIEYQSIIVPGITEAMMGMV